MKECFKKIWSNRLYRKVIIWVVALLMALTVASVRSVNKTIDFSAHLQDTIVTVDDEDVSLQQLSYYIMLCEAKFNAVASVYSPADTLAFWNLHANYTFIRTTAKESAMNTCVRDCIYMHEAGAAGMKLDESDEQEIDDLLQDTLDGLSYKSRTVTRLNKESLRPILERVYLARKYANSILETGDFSEYSDSPAVSVDIGGEYYESICSQHDVEINNKLWDKISLGNITIEKVKVKDEKE